MLGRAVLAVSLTWCVAAGAEPEAAPPFRLHWSAPAGCASETDVEQDMRRLLGASTAPHTAETVEADARVTTAKKGFELRITVGQGDQARTRWLEASTCAELSHAAALIVALAVDPSLAFPESAGGAGVASPPAPAPSPCPEPAAAPVQPLSSERPSPAASAICAKPPQPRAAKPHLRPVAIALGVGAAYGELPQIMPRPSLGAAYRAGPHRLELSLGAAFASTGYRADGRGATFWQWALSPRYCFQTRVGVVSLGPCGIVEASLVKATGFGVTQPKTQRNAWLAPGVGVQAALRLESDAELLLSADLLVVATRTRFDLDSEQIFRPHWVVPALRLTVAAGIL